MVTICIGCGKPIEEPNSKLSRCRACTKIKNHENYLKNTKKIIKSVAIWASNNPDKVREIGRKAAAKWRAKNPDKVKEGNVKRTQSGKSAEAARRYRTKHPDKIEEFHRNRVESGRHLRDNQKYLRTHPHKAKQFRRRRRARKMLVDERFSSADEKYIHQLFGHACFVCGAVDNLTIDHVLPLSGGHALTRSNAVVLCRRCNSSKGAKDPKKFFGDKFDLLKHMLESGNTPDKI